MPETNMSELRLESNEPRRRDLVQLGMGAVAACYTAALGYPVYRYLAAPAERARLEGEVSSVSIPEKDLPSAGAATMFLFGGRPSLLIHQEDGAWNAFDAVCTHLGCTAGFDAKNKRIYCPCHGGTYDMHTGQVVAGPPPRPLKSYKVEVKDGSVLVSRA
jgi:cytochrome b6-f complex iron-sulfur subunit